MVSTPREVWWHWGKIGLGSDVDDQIHADHNVELEVTVEEPVACEGDDGNMEKVMCFSYYWDIDRIIPGLLALNRITT